jgi:hypothetical protein
MVFKKALSSIDTNYHHEVIEYATPNGDFTKWCKEPHNGDMAANEYAGIRRANLKRLIQRDFRDNNSNLARAIRRKATYVSDLTRDETDKSFGERAAGNIEAAIGLMKGQLSVPDSPLLYDQSKRNRVKEELRDVVEELDRNEQEEALAFIRRIQARRRKAG